MVSCWVIIAASCRGPLHPKGAVRSTGRTEFHVGECARELRSLNLAGQYFTVKNLDQLSGGDIATRQHHAHTLPLEAGDADEARQPAQRHLRLQQADAESRRRQRMALAISASLTSIRSSTTVRSVSTALGDGTRAASPSAMVLRAGIFLELAGAPGAGEGRGRGGLNADNPGVR